MTKTLYIHIPFCKRKCIYCDFYSISYREDIADVYIDVLCKQISELEANFSTIYIGGGTPTLLSKRALQKLLKALNDIIFGVKEFTIEANPDSISSDKLKVLIEGGINRISIGLQSLNDLKLKTLGRLHGSKQGSQAVLLANKQGFKNISIDLIFGLPGESLVGWFEDLKSAISLPITHISTYALTYESKTPIFAKLKKGEISKLDDKTVAKMYELAIRYLPKKGFAHYEVSNFAKGGLSCQHNLSYWQNVSYVGLGPSAASFLNGSRQINEPNLEKYIKKYNHNSSLTVFAERLSPIKKAKEVAALKIRTKEGINFSWFNHSVGFDFLALQESVLERLFSLKLLRFRRQNGQNIGVCLTRKGFLFSDEVSSSFL